MGYRRLGIDIGSTTVKVVLLSEDGAPLLNVYRRHNSSQVETLESIFTENETLLREKLVLACVCGSGGKPVAEALGLPFVQEVVANAAAVSTLYSHVRTAVELGGQDAKVVFFTEQDGKLTANDMRMNGICAGGTGAFIDEIATLLKVRTEDFNALAEKGTKVYDISGRCGVFAKTDIQPLLLQGARREDIALSTFHAIVKQTIGGLSQGLELKAPIIFEGGPLTFNPVLVKVFAERLGIGKDGVIVPEHPETMVAYGAAVATKHYAAAPMNADAMIDKLETFRKTRKTQPCTTSKPFFGSRQEMDEFIRRHESELGSVEEAKPENGVLRVYVGMDSGSTTSKVVLMDEDERIIKTFYANNYGEPLKVLCKGLLQIKNEYADRGILLDVLGVGTTGYGEKMIAAAFGADYHTVETVAHATACLKYVPDATFILDIGGQDMKAIWLDNGVITDIMLNEACSSGCGSFLENFAHSLNIPVEQIASTAFKSSCPAKLGSRCTVFMNSTIINEQRNGKAGGDLMAGLCRSIIENVFTKVVRLSNTDILGDKVVVQGGTFRNYAVLRALEEYIGRNVILAPYPGEMGAIGAALLCKRAGIAKTGFIGFEALEKLEWKTVTGLHCGRCPNNCALTVMKFGNGRNFISGNRCDRGAGKDAARPKMMMSGSLLGSGSGTGSEASPVDMFEYRNTELLKDRTVSLASMPKGNKIGIPLVLEFWDSYPFWSTFFKALGYQVVPSDISNRKDYEAGLRYVASDTICFPAKLVHGHILNLKSKGVDSIFFPYVMHMPPEGKDKLSPYVCSVVQGYPMVVRNSQNPEREYGIRFMTPVFHFFTEKDRPIQIVDFAVKDLGVSRKEAEEAFRQAQIQIDEFRTNLKAKGSEVLNEAERTKSKAIVLAGRPYQCDPLVNHGLARLLTSYGVSVLTVDSLPDLSDQDLSHTRVEITNNFHTRMLEAAMVVAKNRNLEYVQMVSFGCGHDAILSDEIIRICRESGHKSPLVLKIDESDATGSIGIRVRSFLESVGIRDSKLPELAFEELKTAFPVKFTLEDKQRRTLLIPNISGEICTLMCGIFKKAGFNVFKVPVGGVEQIHVGKKYSHNDICFPCQMVIGELIDYIQKNNLDQDKVAVGMVKFQCDCRMSHYAALLRKALDAAGLERIPVVVTDPNDTKENQPGVQLLSFDSVYSAVTVFMMLDILKEISRKIRPYETEKGATDAAMKGSVLDLTNAIAISRKEAMNAYKRSLERLKGIEYDRSHLKPRCLVTGELLVTYHPGSNFNIEKYLEDNGMETIFPRVTDQLRKDFQASKVEIRDYKANIPKYPFAVAWLFDKIQKKMEKVALTHPLFTPGIKPADLYKEVSDIIPETLSCGEGWLMAAEIAHYAKQGVTSHIILQPFGCLPNHICGRGTIKRLKEEFPKISILPLDLDPDTSYANVENRLQMLIMNNSQTVRHEEENILQESF